MMGGKVSMVLKPSGSLRGNQAAGIKQGAP
jgi:hypothetical protein